MKKITKTNNSKHTYGKVVKSSLTPDFTGDKDYNPSEGF